VVGWRTFTACSTKWRLRKRRFARRSLSRPCVRGGQVRARVAGLIQNFRPSPADFEGWGLFRMTGEKEAEVLEEAALPLIEQYLKLLMPPSAAPPLSVGAGV